MEYKKKTKKFLLAFEKKTETWSRKGYRCLEYKKRQMGNTKQQIGCIVMTARFFLKVSKIDCDLSEDLKNY